MCLLEKLIKISFRKHVTVVSYRYRYRKLNKNRMDARMLVLLNMIFSYSLSEIKNVEC